MCTMRTHAHASNGRTWLWLLGVVWLVARIAIGHGAWRRNLACVHEGLCAWCSALQLAAYRGLGKDLCTPLDVAGIPAA